MLDVQSPSLWVKRWSHLIKPQGRVLDVACGMGRHAHWFYKQNHPLTLVDKAQEAINSIASHLPPLAFEAHVADIEAGPWPLAGRQFDAVVVTNYLWRPLWPDLLASLAPDGVLIYETFALGQETLGKPSRSDFLLRPGELLTVCANLRVVAFEDGLEPASPSRAARYVQRIVALQAPATPAPPSRYCLYG